MKKLLSVLSISLMSVWLSAQIPIGTFRDHLAYNRFYSVAVADDYVYAAGESGIMYLDKSQLSSSSVNAMKWSKSDGLSDVNISKIAYYRQYDCLVVAYANGNLDLIMGDQLTNVPDVKNKQMVASKVVQQILFQNQYCYLVYQFGVIVLDLSNYLIKDTWYTNTYSDLVLHNMAMSGERIYLATSEGIYSIDAQNPAIADFGEWQKENVFGNLDYNFVVWFDGKLYVNRNSHLHDAQWQLLQSDSVFVLEDGICQYAPQFRTDETRDFNASDGKLALLNWQNVLIYDGVQFDEHFFYEYEKVPSLHNVVCQGENVFVVDDQNGLWIWNRSTNHCLLVTANGPHSNQSYKLSCESGVLAMVPGGYNLWAPAYLPPAYSIFKNEKWSYMDQEFRNDPAAHDLVNVAINPNNPDECFIASWGNGLYKCVNGHIVLHYDQSNSPLRGMTDEEVARVSGICYDAYGNLWVTNSNTTYLLHVLKTDNTWVTINSLRGELATVAQYVYVDSRGYKWITIPRSATQSLYVFDDNNTIDNQTDDRLRLVNMNLAAEVESSVVKCITEDKDGRMWIGTNKGVKLIYDPTRVFDGSSLPRNIIMEQGGYTSVLLEFEEVSCIAVDGANRKWMGTSKAGVFLISANGTEELAHFTADNSFLLSDVIYDIAIDGQTGEVFFSTDKGVCSYRGTATEGSEEYSEVKVFPNPVRSGYTGVIAVSGLMENSFCKIVDAAGNLIWQGYANGGELVWDGKDFKGRRPATGVYFVFSSSKSGKEKNVAKFLFVN